MCTTYTFANLAFYSIVFLHKLKVRTKFMSINLTRLSSVKVTSSWLYYANDIPKTFSLPFFFVLSMYSFFGLINTLCFVFVLSNFFCSIDRDYSFLSLVFFVPWRYWSRYVLMHLRMNFTISENKVTEKEPLFRIKVLRGGDSRRVCKGKIKPEVSSLSHMVTFAFFFF